MAQLKLNTAQWLKLGKKLGYIKKAQKQYKQAAMPGWRDLARVPQATGRAVKDILGGYDPMERHEGLGSTAVSTDLKNKLMQIYQMINSDPAIVNAVPRLGTAMKDMSTFVAQQQEAVTQKEESIQMARGRRAKMQRDIASGRKQVMGVPSGAEDMASGRKQVLGIPGELLGQPSPEQQATPNL